jgi:hypothetical protein
MNGTINPTHKACGGPLPLLAPGAVLLLAPLAWALGEPEDES